MAIYINYSPEQNDSMSANVTVWWCLRCQVYHSKLSYCPFDLIPGEIKEYYDGYQDISYECCPHCGQIIKREA